MKAPCEVIVWYVLPVMRSELARVLVDEHHMKQSEIARIFGVTDAAVCQYLRKKRGSSDIIEGSALYPYFLEQIKFSAGRLADGTSNMVNELCRICVFSKKTGLISEIYTGYTSAPAPACARGDEIPIDVEIPRKLIRPDAPQSFSE